ncbi:MAG: hypothetical protein JSU82_02375 [Rhodospirillales bacterium]|nr:MAG: hypothetical protein JSU82_02375 [Rhodospirillales bacterium]
MSEAGPDFAKQPVRMTRWCARRGRIRIEIVDDSVCVTERSLRGLERWCEPLSAYAGVQISSIVRPGTVLGARRWHEVVLRHRDPLKTIALCGSQRLADARRVWKAAAVALDLPALERTPIGYIARDVEDLEKPYSGLAAARLSGRLVNPFRAPSSIDCRREGAVTRAMLRLQGLEIVPALLLLTLGLLFLFLGSGLGIGLAVAGALLLAFGCCVRQGIEISPDEVACCWMTPIGDFLRRAIPLRELHTVTWTGREAPRRRDAVLLLASDTTEIAFDNLPRSQANWLGRMVLAAALSPNRQPRLATGGPALSLGMAKVAIRGDTIED